MYEKSGKTGKAANRLLFEEAIFLNQLFKVEKKDKKRE